VDEDDENDILAKPGLAARAFESPGIVVFGAVADVTAVIVLLGTETLRKWIAEHPHMMIVISGILLLTTLVAFNAWSSRASLLKRTRSAVREMRITHRSELSKLEAEIERLIITPSPQDRKRFAEFWVDFGPDSALYTWLHDDFMGDKAKHSQLDALSNVHEKWHKDPLHYHDSEIDHAFNQLKTALRKLRIVTGTNYFYDRYLSTDDERYSRIPHEWEGTRADKALEEIGSAWDAVMDSYDTFVRLAHKRHLT